MIRRRARRVLILGEGAAAEALREAWRAAPHHRARRWRVLGTVAPSLAEVERAAQKDADALVLTMDAPPSAELLRALVRARERGVLVWPGAAFYAALSGRVPLEHLSAADWQILLATPPPRPLYAALKRALDVLVALLGLLLFALILPLLAALIALDSRGPIFFRQARVGQGGRIFHIVKLRTMIPDAERGIGPQWARRDDPRATRIGRWLRRARLDEVPQLFNVLRGEMSLVGPRPERPAFVQELERAWPVYRLRHIVKPGITGWAQVQYHYGHTPADARVKLEYDLYYLLHRSPRLDALIVLRTVSQVLRLRGV